MMSLPMFGMAQSGDYVEVQDFESWTSLALKYKLDKKWTFGLQEQIRLDNNSSEIKSFLTQFTTDYKLSKKFEVGLGLRLINKNDNKGNKQGYEHYFRYHFDASYKHKLDRFSFKYRVRYQDRSELSVHSSNEGDPEKYVRFKATADYNIKNWKLDPEISGEIFNPLDGETYDGLSGYRLTVGTNYKIKKLGKIGVSYRLEKELNTTHPKTTNILRLKYTYTLKNKK
ncbi:MAG: DUF2490 domain-containing protein [Reichenbachiella sp.]|uniref:DUF2490 domain-containing protein n=1 Tax=Reichenbachiella sp. TaxID=2184521 RepID=UPI0032977126